MGGVSEAQAARGIARIVERPQLPFQADVTARLNRRDGAGYAARTVLILAPRQVGKTITVFQTMMGRMSVRRAYTAAYTAQAGITVTFVFTNPANGWISLVDDYPLLGARWKGTRSQGREMIRHKQNRGAYLRAFPPRIGALRSTSLDCVILDECQEHDHEIGQGLMTMTGPVFSTRPRRQLVLMGTAPDGPATWWGDQIARARAGEIDLIELGTWPDDADPADPATWRAHHPGLQHGLTDEGFLSDQLRLLGVERFAREYGNRIPGGAALDSPLTQEIWQAARYDGQAPAVPIVIGFDAAWDAAAAAIIAVGRLPDGRSASGVAMIGQGAAWLVDELAGIKRRHPSARLVCDSTGPVTAIADELERRGVQLERLKGEDRPTAHGHLISELSTGRAVLMPHPALDEARVLAKRRWTDAGGWIWSRRLSGDISPLTALVAALWSARSSAAPKPVAVGESRRDDW